MLSFLEIATVATLEKILLNLDNLCLAYHRLLYFAKLVAFQEVVANEVKLSARPLTLFRFEVAFIYFKAKLLGELEITPENLDIFNFATLVTFQEHSTHRNLLLLCISLS